MTTTTVDTEIRPFTIDDVRFVSPDVAIVSCTKAIRDQRDDPATPDARVRFPAAGAMSYVVVGQASGWRIALAQTPPLAK